MAKVFTWPNLQGLYQFLTSNCPNPDIDGIYIMINGTNGTTTATWFGQPGGSSNTVVIKNVPPEWYNDLLAWLNDAWHYWDYYHSYHPSQMKWYEGIKAHLNGKPIPPTESIKYLGRKHIFTKSVFDINQEKYDKWVETHVPGIKQIHEIDNLISKYQFKPGVSNYLAMLKDIRRWIQNGQISVSQAQARIDFIKKKLEEMHLNKLPDIPVDTPKNISQNEYQHVEILPQPVKPTFQEKTTKPVIKAVYEKQNTTTNSNDSMLKTLYALLSLDMLKQKTDDTKTTSAKSEDIFEDKKIWLIIGVVVVVVIILIAIKKKR